MIVLMIVLGAAAGYFSLLLTRRLIRKRAGGLPGNIIISREAAPYIWCAVFSVGYAVIGYVAGGPLAGAEYAAVFTVCVCIGAVDWVTKKIPNSLLLALMINKIAFLIAGGDFSDVKRSVIGLTAAAVIFTIPAFIGMSVGAGDIKLAAVTGLYLGIGGFLQAMIIMAVLITFYGIYLVVGKKGGFRTKTAMGPYLAFGLICTLVFPMFS